MIVNHIFFYRAFITFLFVSSTIFAANKNTCATIDSLTGKAEVQRAGMQNWEPTKKGDKLYNNDVIRVLEKSFVQLGWPDQSASYMHENSQLMLTFYESSTSAVISRHITVFYGAVFFVIKEVFPKTLVKQYNTKVFTPTSVVSLRGTSFSVTVDKTSKTSTIKVVNGTIQVKNILKNTAIFVSAGFKSSVEMSMDPQSPKTVLDKEIDSLKTWVPYQVINLEMATQLAKAARDRNIISGDLKDKLIIIPLVNSSKYQGTWPLPVGIAKMLADKMKLGNINVEIADSANIEPLHLGESQKARYIISGEITDFDIVQHAEISASADNYKEYYIASVHISLQLISVLEKRVLIEDNFFTDIRGSNIKENSWEKTSLLTFSLANPQFSKSLLGQALSQVLDQASEKFLKQLQYE